MKLLVKREFKKPTYTIGKLYIDGEYFCDTLEDKDRGLKSTMSLEQITKKKIKGQTAIPTGTYKVLMNRLSPKYSTVQWAREFCGSIMPRLENVPGYEGILIHPGNTDKDTAGCLLVGFNKEVGKVLNSKETFKKLYKKLLTDKNNITITYE